MTKLLRLALALGALLLTTAAPAAAAPQAVPPGHSGASQYTETLPTAGGEQPTGEVGAAAPAGNGGDPGSGAGTGATGGGTAGEPAAPAPTADEALGTRNAKRLEKLGPEGKAAANLAAAAGPSAARPTGHGAARASGDGAGSSPVKQVVGQLTGTSGSSGMGVVLPLLIVMSVLVAAAFVFARRRPTAARDPR